MPTGPTVYSFEDENRKPLYIGKTIHPKTRIRQHHKEAMERVKQKEFVYKAVELAFYPATSEIETLLLEARLIRLHKPYYNIIQKDDRSSLFIEITRDDFPRVNLIRGMDIKKERDVYGPFRTRQDAELIIKVARRIFHFCQNPPRKGAAKRACFYYHIGQCSGACVGIVTKAEYRSVMGLLKRFLNGRTKLLLIQLERRIKKLAHEQKFEQAAEMKRMYEAVNWATQARHGLAGFLKGAIVPERGVKELQQLLGNYGIVTSLERIEGYDVATLQQTNTVGAMVVCFLGTMEKQEYRLFKIRNWSGGDVGAMREMLTRRFSRRGWEWPDLVMVDGGKLQLSMATKVVPKGIPVIGLAKKEETVVIATDEGYDEIKLAKRSLALRLIQQIRDEAHRFGTGFHKRRRSKSSLGIA